MPFASGDPQVCSGRPAGKIGDANASADHWTAEAAKPSSAETATQCGPTDPRNYRRPQKKHLSEK